MATVLILDDDAWVRRTLCLALERAGYATDAWSDAAAALARVDFDAVDLIITDLSMPLPGDQVIQRLRARGLTTPIMVLSGCLQGPDSARLRALGASRVLAKPYELEVLLGTVAELLAREEKPA